MKSRREVGVYFSDLKDALAIVLWMPCRWIGILGVM